MNIRRKIEPIIAAGLQRGKSILLLGPRQTGKTTLLKTFKPELSYLLISPRIRARFEKNPALIGDEIRAFAEGKHKQPLVMIDEVQAVPAVLDVCQELIDEKICQFLLTGSSARRLRKDKKINLIPGRLLLCRLDPLCITENLPRNIDEELYFGALPAIRQLKKNDEKSADLASYTELYLEEEIRKEAAVRNVGSFARFLELAAIESGHIVNFSAIAQDVGVSAATIRSYYEILEDCLVAEKIEPITTSNTRKKLTKSCRYLIFDLGVRRLAAGEGLPVSPTSAGELFEQFVGLQLVRLARLEAPHVAIRFWRDSDGPEVDFVIEASSELTPIEVKWGESPTKSDARHIEVFLDEYSPQGKGWIVCRTERSYRISDRVTAIPWQELASTLF